MPHQNSHTQFGKDLFSNSIYSSKNCLIIYNFFYLISLGYAAPYPCHPLAPSMSRARFIPSIHDQYCLNPFGFLICEMERMEGEYGTRLVTELGSVNTCSKQPACFSCSSCFAAANTTAACRRQHDTHNSRCWPSQKQLKNKLKKNGL
jgi:hypothetical protein